MSPGTARSPFSNIGITLALGAVIGFAIIGLTIRESRFAGRSEAELQIHINGVNTQMSRDVLLPNAGWVLEIELPPDLEKPVADSLIVTLRAERTGGKIDISDRFERREDRATLVIPESLGLFAGLLSIDARLTDRDGHEIEAYRRVRIRRWLGGPPIGSREIIHFDFTVDRDGDGTPDFERDLQRLGLAPPDSAPAAQRKGTPDLARALAERALARVLRAYDRYDDPNRTGTERDQVFVRFMLESEPSPFVTRICVGGKNHAHPDSIGNVRFDLRNQRKSSNECNPRTGNEDEPNETLAAGLFPSEFTIYRESSLFKEVFDPFLPTAGGRPLGSQPEDAAVVARFVSNETIAAEPTEIARSRALATRRALHVFADALGTVMAHESAHALGLVPKGKPGVGLFGSDDEEGSGFAHNVDVLGNTPETPWLMNPGDTFRFEDLAGLGEAGELVFRPLNYAYLKDRLVLVEGRR